MSAIANQVRDSSTLISAADAIRNYRALALALGGIVAAAIVLGLISLIAGAIGSLGLGFLGGLIALAILLVGVNGAGVLLLDEAVGQPPRPIGDAVVAGVFATGKLVVVGIAALLVVLACMLALALVYWICKIPALGPVLFAFTLPAGVLAMGLLLFALACLLAPIAAPAIWSGETITRTLARVVVVAQKRLVNVLILDIVLGLICLVAAAVVVWVLVAGLLTAGAIAGSIVGLSFDSMMGGGVGAQGHLLAGGIGFGVLWLVGSLVPGLILLKGFCLIYIAMARELDFSQAEAEFQHRVQQVKEKAEAARERVQQRKDRPQ